MRKLLVRVSLRNEDNLQRKINFDLIFKKISLINYIYQIKSID